MKNYENLIYIAGTQYTSSTTSLDIFVSGCKPPHCEGCQNSELFEFGQGTILDDEYIKEIINKIIEFKKVISNVFIYGGEPLDQDIDQLISFLKKIKNECDITLYLFTKYPLKDVSDTVKGICDYIKCGRYMKDLSDDNYRSHGIKLSTTNQVIYKKNIDY